VSAAVLERLRERRRQVARRLPIVVTTRRRSQASHAEHLQLGMDYAAFIIRRDVEASSQVLRARHWTEYPNGLTGHQNRPAEMVPGAPRAR